MTTTAIAEAKIPAWCPSCGKPHQGIDICPSCFKEQLLTPYCLICGCVVKDGTCMNLDCARQDLTCRAPGVSYSSNPPARRRLKAV